MSWPLSHEFNEAVQNPQVVFADPDLKSGETVVGATGLPLPRSGNFADVYQVRGADGREWAVKCFTRPVAGLAERYARVGEALERADLPFAVGFTFLAEGIRVGGAWRPVVKMEWVEGLLLNQMVRENAGSLKVLGALSQMWVKLCRRLREAGIAHADVQHGNVLLVPGSRPGAYGLKLIDYDGMYVPALANTPSGEAGHPSFQHPARAATRAYSPDVDRFPHLAVATALRGLSAVGPALWERYDNGDNVLFTEADYKKPAESRLMRELWQTNDPAVQALVGRLAVACGKPIPQTPWLDQLAPEGEPLPLDGAARREAAEALGIALPVPVSLPPEPAYQVTAAPAPVLTPAPIPVPAPEPLPEPLPPPPPAPLKPLIIHDDADDEPEPDVEPARDARPARKKPKSRRVEEDEPKSNGRVLLLAGGGLLLLVGGVVAGVLIAGGKSKAPDTVQQKPDEPKEPKEPKEVPPKPKDKQPGPIVPGPKDKDPDPAVPVPKDKGSDPLVPRPGEKFLPRQAWAVNLEGADRVVCSRDGRTVAAVTATGELAFFDADTHKRLEGPPDHFDRSALIVPLDGGRFASGVARGPTVPVWDPRAGRLVQSISTAGLPVPGIAYVSPTGKYIAVTTNNTPADGKEIFRLKNVQTDKVIKDMTWARGSVHFTDDESRVLVASGTGECWWFKLPSGELDAGGWTFDRKGPDHSPQYGIKAMAGDGSAVVFWGSYAGKPLGGYVLDGTGTLKGNVARNAQTHPPSISRDGRLVLVHTPAAGGKPDRVAVLDSATGARVVDFSAPPEFPDFRPVLLPDGRGCVAVLISGQRRVVARFDFVPAEGVAVAPKPPDPAPPAPGEPPALKPKWTTPTGEYMHRVYLTSSGKIVLGGAAGNRDGVALDAATGAPVAGFADFVKGGAYHFFPLTGNRVGKWQLGAKTIHLADEQTGRESGQQAVFDVPRPGPDSFPLAGISPNHRFIATGWTQGGPKFDTQQPLRVLNLMDKAKEVLKLDWAGGSVHFTADSSRVLVAEHTGRCRWYKLPSGEPDDGWDFGAPAQWRHDITGVSADGSVLAYTGVLDGRLTAASVDGKTGAILQRFTLNNSTAAPAISADGRRIAVPATERMGLFRIDLADTRTGAIVGRISTGARLVSCCFSQDGTLLALAVNEPASVQVFDVPGGAAAAAGAAAGRLEVRAGWTADLPADLSGPKLHVTGDAKFVAVASEKGAPVVLDTATGKTLPTALDRVAPSTKWYPLGGSRFALGALGAGKTIPVVDVKTGQTTQVPGIPTPGMVYQFVSPDLKYAAVGAANNLELIPFKLKNTADGTLILDFNWHRGHVLFTADSSRALVAEDSGRCRWFKLPSGELEKEWALEPAKLVGVIGRRLFAASADGSVLLYDGELVGHDGAYHVIDGRTGKVARSLAGPYATHFGTMSADGGLAILPKRAADQKLRTADVVHLATGKVLAELSAPPGSDFLIPSILPDGSGAVAYYGSNKVMRFDFVAPGAAGPAPPRPPDPVPPKPGAAESLKEKWSVDVTTKLVSPNPYFDDDGQVVALVGHGVPWGTAAFNAKTGAAIRELLNPPIKGDFYHLFPLDKGKFGYQTYSEKDILVWDPTGSKTSRITIPAGAPRSPMLNVSPNGRFVAIAQPRPDPGAGGAYPESPFQLIDITNNRAVLSFNWPPGTTVFAPDSARVLVVDATDRFRWYKLPAGGKPVAEWSFGREASRGNAQVLSVAADGGTILYYGRPPDKELTHHLLDGKTGEVLHSFPAKRYLSYRGAVSDDGRLVGLVRTDGFGTGHTVEVLDARGALVATAKIPQDRSGTMVAFSWKARLVVLYERTAQKLTAYELPAAPP